jgi:hypothetical protein
VLSKSGEWLPVVSVEESAQKSTVYNFEVKGTHSHFAGKQGVLVHNVSRFNLAILLPQGQLQHHLLGVE